MSASFITELSALSAAGEPFVAVTLIDAVGSTPQDAGSKMLVDGQGLVYGTVGGGRVEHRAVEHARRMLADRDGARTALVAWNLKRDVGMTCGGSVKLFFEAYNCFAWRLVIFGAGHVSQALIRVLLQLDCDITCIDPRGEWLGKLPSAARLECVQIETMADYVEHLTGSEYVLTLTMGHASDLPVLQAVFRSGKEFPYIGVIGSAAKRQVLVRDLGAAGVLAARIEELHCPLGMDLGTNHPGDIAVSIAAELISLRSAPQR